MRLAVVGRGLIGASAARHLARLGHNITLVGPSEPSERSNHNGVFASHYDEGRITRLLDPDPVWEDLARASIGRYGQIARESGIAFFDEVGLLIGAPRGSEYLARVRAVRDEAGVAAQELTGTSLATAFDYLSFDDDMVMLHQKRFAGHVSPRRLVDAQTQAARKSGAKIVEGVVHRVRNGAVKSTAGDMEFDRVLVACGAFTNMVLARPLAFKVLGRTIALCRLSEENAARLSAMPSVIYRVADGSDPYVLPPIRYPDGAMYLKIGGEPKEKRLCSTDEIKDWFKTSGDADVGAYQLARIKALLPDLDIEAMHTESCAVTFTETGRPYIGPVDDRVVVAAGGCGGAAKSCDEIGRIAAAALLGETDPRFGIVWEDDVQ